MKIVIVVRGGMLVDVLADNVAEVIVVDHDNIKEGDPPATELLFEDGTTAQQMIDLVHETYGCHVLV